MHVVGIPDGPVLMLKGMRHPCMYMYETISMAIPMAHDISGYLFDVIGNFIFLGCAVIMIIFMSI